MRLGLYVSLICICFTVTADSQQALDPSEVMEKSTDVIMSVGDYSRTHPKAPGSFQPWISEIFKIHEPILIHSYPDLRPSYYFILVSNEQQRYDSFITLNALDGTLQAFGQIPSNRPFSLVSRANASQLIEQTLGRIFTPEELLVVSLPNKSLYWYIKDNTKVQIRELFINLQDISDFHNSLDTELQSPLISIEPPLKEQQQYDLEHSSQSKYPQSYNINGVPHHYQVTSYHCGPASTEMVLDYWGPDIDQTDIGNVANCLSSEGGSWTSDNRRAGHFSSISTAVLDDHLHGYYERALGYGAIECWWSWPDETDPDYADRYSDLKNLISSDYPIMVLTWYDAAHYSGHYRVVKGYDDNTDVFIVHDPWYSGTYYGPNVHFNQSFFVDNLWTKHYRWGVLMAPWKIEFDSPIEVMTGEDFTITVEVLYHGPHPYYGYDLVSTPNATITVPTGLELAPGETYSKTLIGLTYTGTTGSATWQVIAGSQTGLKTLSVLASGFIYDSSHSYSSYSDSIGGSSSFNITILQQQYVTISGYVKDAAGAGIQGVVMSGLPHNPVTSSSGAYADTVAHGWSGTVTPQKTGWQFTPPSRSYNDVNSDQSDQDYDGTFLTYTISGQVKDEAGIGIQGVVLSGLPHNPSTNSNGYYTDTVDHGWSGTVTPQKTGWQFTPPSMSYSDVTSDWHDQDYDGVFLTYTISGYVKDADSTGIQEVEMNGLPENPRTDFNGYYIGTVDHGWSGTVTPQKNGWQFTPPSKSYSDVTSDWPNQDYSGVSLTYTISGYVMDADSVGIQDVVIDSLPDNPHTDFNGYYIGTVDHDWSGTVTPQKDGYTFTPPWKQFNNVISNQPDQNYIGEPNTYIEGDNIEPQLSKMPESYELFQNYPNPFNSLTHIRFALSRDNYVLLRVYNIIGELLKELVNEELPAGYYERIWDGSDSGGMMIASGIYLVRMETDEYSKIVKVVLLR